MTTCLMCGNTNSRVVGSIKVKKICNAYLSSLKVDINKLFPSSVDILQLNECEVCGLKWYYPPIVGDDHFYEGLQQLDGYYPDFKPEYDFAKKFISENDHILEVGCGKGAFHKFIKKNTYYRGLEFNQMAVENARAIGLDVDAISIEDESSVRPDFYDVVCHFQVLEHVTDPRIFLEDCIKSIKPGGKLIVAVPSEDSFLKIFENFCLNMPPHHQTRWSDKALKSAFFALGLLIMDIWHEPVRDYHTGWYRSAIITYGLKNCVFSKIGMGSDRFWSKVSGRLSRYLSRISYVNDFLFNIGEKSFVYSGRGHTVCVVATKKI